MASTDNNKENKDKYTIVYNSEKINDDGSKTINKFKLAPNPFTIYGLISAGIATIAKKTLMQRFPNRFVPKAVYGLSYFVAAILIVPQLKFKHYTKNNENDENTVKSE